MTDKKVKKEVTIMYEGKPFTVPPGGTLGVLALGSVGVRAWKKAREIYFEKEGNEQKN
jgi:hypothetical protein